MTNGEFGNKAAFYRSHVFLSGNTHDIFFNKNSEKDKRQNACSQMISVFMQRKYGMFDKSCLRQRLRNQTASRKVRGLILSLQILKNYVGFDATLQINIVGV